MDTRALARNTGCGTRDAIEVPEREQNSGN